jgi:hypothetical protein
MFSYSTDEERFHGQFETRGEAITEVLSETKSGQCFWVGENRAPTPPEDLWEAEDWLEHVSCQDEYSGDYAEGWDSANLKQREELEAEVRAVMAKWLDKHDLRPKFWCVDNVENLRNENGVAVLQFPKTQKHVGDVVSVRVHMRRLLFEGDAVIVGTDPLLVEFLHDGKLKKVHISEGEIISG